MHAKVGDHVRTGSGRSGVVRSYTERPDGGWTVDVEIDDDGLGHAVTLPYEAADLTVMRPAADGVAAGDRSHAAATQRM